MDNDYIQSPPETKYQPHIQQVLSDERTSTRDPNEMDDYVYQYPMKGDRVKSDLALPTD